MIDFQKLTPAQRDAYNAILFSCPIQLITFVRWSKNSYRQSTKFRRLTVKQRIFQAYTKLEGLPEYVTKTSTQYV